MENASQALFMAAGVLIAVMIISIGVYLFSSASTISESYDRTMSATEIQKFNSQFSKYEKNPRYIENVFYDYNTVSDVVSAMNLAYSINAKNNYDEQSGVSIFVTCDNDEYCITPEVQEIICNSNELNEYDKKNKCFRGNEVTIDSIIAGNIKQTDLESLNTLLSNYNESRLLNGERLYKYGFRGVTSINSETGLIDKIEFTLVENENYNQEST